MGDPRVDIPVGAVPVPAWVRRLVVFGGTFDPPHMGHMKLPNAARAALGFEWVLFMPAARSPHKSSGPLASDEDRVAMLAAGLDELRTGSGDTVRESVSTLEIERARTSSGSGGSYTIDTLRALAEALPGVTMRLLIGADQAAAFARWREPREIIRLAEPVVMLRSPVETTQGLMESMRTSGGWSDDELAAWRGRVVHVPLIQADATSIRAALARGGASGASLAGVLAESTRRLIVERALYGARG